MKTFIIKFSEWNVEYTSIYFTGTWLRANPRREFQSNEMINNKKYGEMWTKTALYKTGVVYLYYFSYLS